MNIIERIKEYFKKLFNKTFSKNTIKYIEATKEEENILKKNTCNAKKKFEESLRVKLETTKKSKLFFSSDSHSIIETLQCINDGLGFQTLKKY